MKQWLSDFKLALIQEDVNKLENLLDELDMKAFSEDFLKENANDVFYQVQALLQEAVILIEQKKKTKAIEIQKFQKALTYFKS
ncbi:hypothetical protein KZ082_000069 [Campylobacter jejuni]|nr:hypothetical protein [Campylobacter jejuni]